MPSIQDKDRPDFVSPPLPAHPRPGEAPTSSQARANAAAGEVLRTGSGGATHWINKLIIGPIVNPFLNVKNKIVEQFHQYQLNASLHRAVKKGDVNEVAAWLGRGAVPNDNDFNTAFEKRQTGGDLSKYNVIFDLLKIKTQDQRFTEVFTKFLTAAERGDTATVQLFNRAGIDKSNYVQHDFLQAVKNGGESGEKKITLYRQARVDINSIPGVQREYLEALGSKNSELIQRFIRAGMNTDKATIDRAYLNALNKGDHQMIHLLSVAGFDINAVEGVDKLFAEAILSGRTEDARLLFINAGFKIHRPETAGKNNVFHYLCADERFEPHMLASITGMMTLEEFRETMQATNASGKTPFDFLRYSIEKHLISAIRSGDTETITALLFAAPETHPFKIEKLDQAIEAKKSELLEQIGKNISRMKKDQIARVTGGFTKEELPLWHQKGVIEAVLKKPETVDLFDEETKKLFQILKKLNEMK